MTKKYMSLEGLQEYDALLKQEIADSVSGKANASHTHSISNVSGLQSALDGKAPTSHGTHVPTVQTANNAKFLRNDNTWQTVTPANIGAATSGHTHISLSGWSDTRGVDTVPNDYNSKFIVSGLKSNSTIGISNGGTYSGVVGFRSWSDSSGGDSQEIAFAANGNLYRRHGSTTEWGDWLQFIDSGNIGSQSVASATKATQDASGNVITSTYETKANASSKLTEAKTYTDTVASGKANTSHTHSYAGSASVGGSATSAVKLDTSTAGSATQPVYFSGGKPVACTYTLSKSVPSNAVFTDTNTKVTNTLATTTKAYVTGTTSASTNTGTQVFDTGVYLDTAAGQLTATTFNGTTFSGSGVATLAEVQSYLGI